MAVGVKGKLKIISFDPRLYVGTINFLGPGCLPNSIRFLDLILDKRNDILEG